MPNSVDVSMIDLKNLLKALEVELEFNQIEIGVLEKPLSIDFYDRWLSKNLFGTMRYLVEHAQIKRTPQLINPDLKSVITFSQAYYPIVHKFHEKVPARLSTYSQNSDYHYWLKDKLTKVIQQLTDQFPNQIFLPYIDSGPILERNWAYQNGHGWFGKNSCLIHPKFGSLFFIAEILTDLKLPLQPDILPLPDFCGKCTKCIDACPTQAIQQDRTLKADQCISYLTIEAKGPPPEHLRPKINDWFFGCDICQTVCPWNIKLFKIQKHADEKNISSEVTLSLSSQEKTELIKFFKFLLTASHKQIQKKFIGSPLSRAGAKGLKRNALIVIANRKLDELKAEVINLKSEPYFEELAQWTLTQLELIP